MSVKHIHSVNEFDELVTGDKLVLVDFFATWCGPCRMLSPILDKVAVEYTNAVIVKVDVDELPELAARYGVTAMPTLKVFKDGSDKETAMGAQPYPKVKALIDSHI